MGTNSTPASPDEETAVAELAYTLVVIHPFGKYRRGDPITDPTTIAKVAAGDNAHHCNRVAK